MTDDAKICARWTKTVQTLAIFLLATLLVLATLTVREAVLDGEHTHRTITVLLALSWLVWFLLQISNYCLVRCGPAQLRHAKTPAWINRPEFSIRMANHLVVNWSAAMATLFAVQVLNDIPFAREFLMLSAAATVLTWAGFNLLHRQMNRLRNAFLSTSIAIVLIFFCVELLSRQ